MNILHIINDLTGGGAQRMLSNVVINEKQNKHIIIVLQGQSHSIKAYDYSKIQIYFLDIKLHTLFNCFNLIHNLVRKNQIEVIQTWLYMSDLVGGIYKLLNRGVKLFWNIRHGQVDKKTMSTSSFIAAKVCSKLSFLPNKIISNSQRAIENHIHFGYKKDKFILIYNFVDTERFVPAYLYTRGLLDVPVKFGYAARFAYEKGHRVLFDALELLPSEMKAEFILVGMGMDKFNRDLSLLMDSKKINHNIKLLGFCDRMEELVKFYNDIDFHVSSSLTEGFPNAICESLSCAIPNIVTDVGESAFLAKASGWTVPALDPKELSLAMLAAYNEISKNHSEYLERRERARLSVTTRFKIDQILKEYVTTWESD